MKSNLFQHKHKFELEKGGYLPELEIKYHTAGKLNKDRSNVIWACHALTANSDVFEWWPGLFGKDDFFNPDEYFIISANIIGSCYGSTGPLSINPETDMKYHHDFPEITVKDMVKAHQLLRGNLGIDKIHLLIGGSLGGQQALEWAIQEPEKITNLALIATNARMSPWGIAFNESQRMAISADPSWKEAKDDAGSNGLMAARSIALLSYRNAVTYNTTQSEDDNDLPDTFRVESYQRYQGEKLVKRFNSFSYWNLSKVLDSHNVGRGKRNIRDALRSIKARTIVIGIESDLLFPISEQKFLASYIPNAIYKRISSLYGHDGFLIETEKLAEAFQKFLGKRTIMKLNEVAAWNHLTFGHDRFYLYSIKSS
ncbi:MAG: homoserine O-acetyltransferase [Bacteroidales bacterium]|nr:homoserine O-acetyltransferase [Bacteroidales bacterium]